MKVAAVATILFATLALASPAPVAQPEAAPLARPEDLAQLKDALAARAAEPVPEIDARTAGVQLDSRDPKRVVASKRKSSSSSGGKSKSSRSKKSSKSSSKSKSKPKTPKGSNNSTSEGAADMITPSRTLQLGAVGLGVMEIVRLWG